MFASVDTETLGLNPNTHSAIEVAFVPLDPTTFLPDGRPIFQAFLKPYPFSLISQEACEINGTWKGDKEATMTYLLARGMDGYKFRQQFNAWLEACNDKSKVKPIGHNFMFDHAMLEAWFTKTGNHTTRDIFDREVACTKNLAFSLNHILKTKMFTRLSLDYLTKYFGIEIGEAHTATADAIATAKLYNQLVNL